MDYVYLHTFSIQNAKAQTATSVHLVSDPNVCTYCATT